MTGRILGFDTTSNTGSIAGDNGNRYNFSKVSFKENIELKKDMKVDFSVNDENQAVDIYTLRDHNQENTSTMFGLIAIVITFFLGFIGTLISRIALAKQSFAEALIPTAVHFVLTLLVFIPVVGWLAYIIGTAYFMYKNYLLATGKE